VSAAWRHLVHGTKEDGKRSREKLKRQKDVSASPGCCCTRLFGIVDGGDGLWRELNHDARLAFVSRQGTFFAFYKQQFKKRTAKQRLNGVTWRDGEYTALTVS
jgi:hypothetical protein